MPRGSNNEGAAFLQLGRRTKGAAIVGLTLPNLANNCSYYCPVAAHYLRAKLIEMETGNVTHRVFMPDGLAEAKLFDLNLKEMYHCPQKYETAI